MWMLSDPTILLAVAFAALWAIAVVALLIHGRHDAIRFFTARDTWIGLGKFILGLIALFGGFILLIIVGTYIPWPTFGLFLAALLGFIFMAFQAVWDWLGHRSPNERLLIIAIVMTCVIVGTNRSAVRTMFTIKKKQPEHLPW